MPPKKNRRRRFDECAKPVTGNNRAAYSAREAALRILAGGMWNDDGREAALRGLEERDRALASAIAAGAVRMRGAIDYYLAQFLHRDLSLLPPAVLNLLRAAVFQLRWLDRVPDWAVVNESVELARRVGGGRYQGLVNAVLRRFIREGGDLPLPSLETEPVRGLAVRHSFPEWLVERWLQRFGLDETVELLEACNKTAPLVLRTCPAGREILAESLRGSGVAFQSGLYVPGALVLESGANPARLPGYGEGLFYVQDEAAMLVGFLAAPGNDGLVLDLCAAPGGKATHLAELAGTGAAVMAAEPAPVRLAVLRRNIKRLRIDNVFGVAADSLHPPFRPADLVLCDVPCSGTGVLRRKPGLRWRIKAGDMISLPVLQADILKSAADCVRPGGVLVYSTCSLEPEENRAVVLDFLQNRTDFRLQNAGEFLPESVVSQDGFLETMPHRHEVDGVFGARLVRHE